VSPTLLQPSEAEQLNSGGNQNCAQDDPIHLPNDQAFMTLRDAGEYIQALPPRTERTAGWQTATRILIAAAEGRDDLTMHARIAILKALG
jgi:hypothetical protein